MKKLFDENGFLNLDEVVAQSTSFKKIMEDGIVTDEELKGQVEKVIALLHQVEQLCNDEQLETIRESIGELSVLFAVYHYKTLQEVRR